LYFGPAAAKHGAYPCEQLARAERFGQIVVGCHPVLGLQLEVEDAAAPKQSPA